MDTLEDIIENLAHISLELACHAGDESEEWYGPCPFCKRGDDRFRVWPNEGRDNQKYLGRYWCRKCNKHGDTIQFLREIGGMSYADACAYLDIDPSVSGIVQVGSTRQYQPVDPPGDLWQDSAEDLIREAEAWLWGPAGDLVRQYLREVRGLRDETIKKYRLGLIRASRYEPSRHWGVPCKDVFIPAGIVIPGLIDGDVWYVKVRQALDRGDDLSKYLPSAGHSMKYLCVTSSRPAALFGADTVPGKDTVVVVEGEFDQMILDQEAGDLVGSVTSGSASNKLPPESSWKHLRNAKDILLVLDNDDAGRQAAAKLKAELGVARLVPLVGAKDLCEFHTRGGSMRKWIASKLKPTAIRPPVYPDLVRSPAPVARPRKIGPDVVLVPLDFAPSDNDALPMSEAE